MALTWKDAVHTSLTALVVGIYLAVTRSWGWPMLGGYRMGVLAIGIVGIVMCSLAGPEWAGRDGLSAPKMSTSIWIASALGGLALALFVAGLVVASHAILLALTVDVVVLWAVATLRHAAGSPARREQASIHV